MDYDFEQLMGYKKANPVNTDSKKIIHQVTKRDHYIRFLEKEIHPKTLQYISLWNDQDLSNRNSAICLL